MNDVGGSESGTGHKVAQACVKSSRTSDTNFDAYDDDQWDVGIGNLIIDLDADIEKNNEANRTGSNSTSSSSGGGTVTTTTGNNSVGSLTTTLKSGCVKVSTGGGGGGTASKASTNSSSSSTSLGSGNGKSLTTPSDLSKSLSSVSMEHSAVVEKGLKMKIKRSKPGTKSVDAKHEIVKSDVTTLTSGGGNSSSSTGSSSSGKNSSLNTPNESKLSSAHGKEKQQDKDNNISNSGGSNNNTNSNNNNNSTTTTTNTTTTSKNEDSGGGSANSSSVNNNNEGGGCPGAKVKAPKRGSTHKKVKSGATATTTPTTTASGTNSSTSISGSTPNNKKDTTVSESKSSSSSTSSTTSHVKDMIFNVSVGSTPGISTATSAFVKTSSGTASSIKGGTTTSSGTNSSNSSGGNLLGHSSDTFGNSTTQGSAFRSQQHSTSSNASSWPDGSPVKGEKGQGRLSPSVTTTPNTSDSKNNTTNSPSYGKKPRVFAQSEKSSLEDLVSHPHGNISGSNSSSPYRTSVTLSSASLNDLNNSCSSSILHQGTSQPGTTTLSSSNFNSTKDATNKAGRVPPSSSHDMCVGTTVGTVTEPDCLGPCEPGTSVTLEGIVWHETESGVLVVNVTWRGKTYVGTLLDCTKNDWAPPRFCDSPTSDLEMRNPKNRGKRGRAQTATPVNDPNPADARTGNAKLRNGVKGRRGSSTTSAFVTPVSPLKPDPWPKRKTRGSENESQEEAPITPKNAKRPKVSSSSSSSKDSTNASCNSKERQSNSPASTGTSTADAQSGPFSPALIECPEPNCSKKYKHINGLRYHQSHAHSNNFTPEDSDSNMSTASTTNANNLGLDVKSDGNGGSSGSNNENADSILPSSDSRLDVVVDMEIGSTAADVENISSALTTATTGASTKKNNNSTAAGLSGAKITPTDSQIKETTAIPVVPVATSTVSRTPILTVPVPFSSLSLQNRSMAHAHGQHHHGHGNSSSTTTAANNLGTMSRSETLVNDKSNNPLNRDDVSVMKPQVVTVPSSTNSSSAVSNKGAPWQPHAHSHSSSPGSHTAHVISSLHSQQQQSIGNVPLTVPIITASLKDHDKNKTSKDKSPSESSSILQQQTKKQKHKKKSKEKDRERGGRGDGNKNGSNTSSKTFSGQNSTDKGGKDLTDRHSSSLEESDKDGKGGDRDGAGSGENRDDPQSPAYSDISDANESGPESDLNVGGGSGGSSSGVNASTVKENCVKNLPPELANKKDSVGGVGIPHSISSFFPAFYPPYSMEAATNPNSAPPGGTNPNNLTPKPSDGNRPSPPDEPLSNVDSSKTKGKSSSSSSSHPHLHHGHHGGTHSSHSNVPPSTLPPSSVPTDERRSPKVDYSLNKYLPQHYFAHYPYSNPYHFDQPYGPSILTENYPTNHNRVFMDEKEREIQVSNESRGPPKKPTDKDESPINSLIGNIKLEPGVGDRHDKDRDRRDKEIRSIPSMVMDKEYQDIKAEFGENIYGEKRSGLNLLPPQHFMTCSKHSKDAKRDRDDRHSSKDIDMTKETGQMKSGSGRNSVEGKSGKNLDRDRDSNDGDKDGKDKNEGSKPTMETSLGPPPPTGSYAYIPQSYLPGGFGIPFDPSHPLYRQVLVPGPYPGSPYMHPSSIPRYPPTPGSTPLPEDLSRPSGPPGPPGSAKALDLLQHHAAQYYASHKIHELQERALKSPSPQVPGPQGGPGGGAGQNLSGTPNSPGGLIVPERPVRGNIGGGGSNSGNAPGTALASNKPADLTKDSKPVIIGGLPGQPSESRSPPTQHHVHSHTHHHTHVLGSMGYPVINQINHPTVPPQYSPQHYGVLAAPSSVTAVAASVITPGYPSQKPN